MVDITVAVEATGEKTHEYLFGALKLITLKPPLSGGSFFAAAAPVTRHRENKVTGLDPPNRKATDGETAQETARRYAVS